MDLFSIITYLYDKFGKIIRDTIDRILNFIYRYRNVFIILCIILLLLDCFLANKYYDRSSEYEKIFSQMLQADLEPTPQRFKGFEAFILSDIKDQTDQNEFKNLKLHDSFIKHWNYSSALLKTYFSDINKKNYPTKLIISPGNGNNEGFILTDTIEPGYLFLPVHIMRMRLFAADQLNLQLGKISDKVHLINKALQSDPILNDEIKITGFLSQYLDKFRGVAVFDTEGDSKLDYAYNPSQVYIITKDGLNRIFKGGSQKSIQLYYGSQFPSTTFFPNRPYFWKPYEHSRKHTAIQIDRTFDELEKLQIPLDSKLGDYFYVSKPYLDLGGNGLVVTLSRGIDLNGIKSVICFDLPYGRSRIAPIISKKINSLDGYIYRVKCVFQPGNPAKIEYVEDLTSQHFLNPIRIYRKLFGFNVDDNLKDLIDVSQSNIQRFSTHSEVLGNILVFSSYQNELLRASLPVNEVVYKSDNTAEVELLLIEVDLASFKSKTTLIVVISILLLIFIFLIFSTLLWLTNVHNNEYRRALLKVDQVMRAASNPYVRLDEDDRIVNYNLSFAELLNIEESEPEELDVILKGKLFSSFIANQSSSIYSDVQKKRKQNIYVEPYPIKFMDAKGKQVEVTIVSADIPTTDRDEMPETFGIFLLPNEPENYDKYLRFYSTARKRDNT